MKFHSLWTAAVALTLVGTSSAAAQAALPVKDTTPPKVVSTTPVSNAANVGLTTKPVIAFNESISTSGATLSFAKNGTAVPFSAVYYSSLRSVIVTPTAALAYGTKYTMSARVKDTAGNLMTAPYSFSFTTVAAPVPPAPVDKAPTADLTLSPASGTVPLTVHLDASGSKDDKAVASYQFDFGDGSGGTLPNDVSVMDHVYTKVGTFTARVVVRDSANHTATASATVTVSNVPAPPVDNPPVAKLKVTAQTGTASLSVTADASDSTDDKGIDHYVFNWGDGSEDVTQPGSTGVHEYKTGGTYTVRVTVVDSSGKSTATTTSITVTAPVPPPPLETGMPTVISLTWDDSPADQLQAVSLMDKYNMKGTFYVNTAQLGQPDYMTWNQLSAMSAKGHEISGHTLDHPNLPTMTAEEQTREICDDRAALTARGYAAKSFAYPFGAWNETTKQIVKNCGYSNARIVSGIRSAPYGCFNCQTAETVPAGDMFAIKSPASIKQDTTLDVMKSFVTQAEKDQGGWVPMVFHHVCDGTACDEYSVAPATLAAFLEWLSHRPSTTVVKTVDAVVSGAPLPQPVPTGPNLLQNASLESYTVAATPVPVCFTRSKSSGTLTTTWARVTDAHTGTSADKLTVTGWASGDAGLVVDLNSTTCAPTVKPGTRYLASVWYKGTGGAAPSARAAIVVYYNTAANPAFKYWQTGPSVSLAADWTQTSYVTPALPADATHISYGLKLVGGNGTLTVDDLHLSEFS